MKTLTFTLLTILLLAGKTHAGDVEAVQAQVQGFYHWYVHALNVNDSAQPQKSAAVHRYVSERFLKEVARKENSADGLDSDPFICGQDWDPGWEKNIRVKDMGHQGARRSVQVELTGKKMAAHRLNLVLVREDGAWKIDRVSDGDTR